MAGYIAGGGLAAIYIFVNIRVKCTLYIAIIFPVLCCLGIFVESRDFVACSWSFFLQLRVEALGMVTFSV